MKNISLKDLLIKIAATDQDRLALRTPTHQATYRELFEFKWEGPEDEVLVCCKDFINLSKVLVALDGSVSSICVVGSEVSESDLLSILDQKNFSHIITDLDFSERSEFNSEETRCVSVSSLQHRDSLDDWSIKNTLWFVPTSGTTSVPKLVIHSLDSLAKSALKTSNPASAREVWALFYDVSRYAGYQVFFRALIGGHALVIPDFNASLNERISFCARAGVTHISATPTLWRKILMCSESDHLNLNQITLGGEAADQGILNALRRSFPRARITHVYASTETGVGMSVSDGLAGFPMAFTERDSGLSQVLIRGNRLFIRSLGAGQGYSGAGALSDDEGWVATGDIVRVEGERFHILGRESGVLNIGGDKVIPEYVRNILLENKNVCDAVIYGKQNPFTGILVAADIKLNFGIDQAVAKHEIEEFLKERLSSHQRPRVIRFVDEIEVNLTGKAAQTR